VGPADGEQTTFREAAMGEVPGISGFRLYFVP
jgi:hypothetical protein